jgi:hypothetical protein
MLRKFCFYDHLILFQSIPVSEALSQLLSFHKFLWLLSWSFSALFCLLKHFHFLCDFSIEFKQILVGILRHSDS